MIEALDAERLALAASFGLSVRSVEDHYVASFGVERATLAEMSAAVTAKKPDLRGPTTLDTRFVTEDVPFGLLPLAMLGKATGVPMPLHQAGIDLFSALYGRDFAAENDLLPVLGITDWPPQKLHGALQQGWPSK